MCMLVNPYGPMFTSKHQDGIHTKQIGQNRVIKATIEDWYFLIRH